MTLQEKIIDAWDTYMTLRHYALVERMKSICIRTDTVCETFGFPLSRTRHQHMHVIGTQANRVRGRVYESVWEIINGL